MDPVRLELDGLNMDEISEALQANDDAYAADVDAGQMTPAVCELLERVRRAPAISDETDNGYRNHETFLAAMQLAGNMTPGGIGEVYNVRAAVAAAVAAADVESERTEASRQPVAHVADALREYLERLVITREVSGAWARELATAALGRVDWHELATEQLEAFREDVRRAG